MTVSSERLARNQVIFHEVNERLREIAGPAADLIQFVCECGDPTFRHANERLGELADVQDGQRIPFLCECADIACLGSVEASLGEFDVIREDPYRYFVLPGHLRIDGEEIGQRNGRYDVVSKEAV
jgi:hypothetical protein